jgi:4-amino-4-deoxychorismate lyase
MSAQSALRDGDGTGFDLIETMRWEPEAGFVRLERHLARLYGSASTLGFACDPERIGQTLTNTVGNAAAPLRIRLVLSPNGDVAVSAQPFEPLPPGKVWTLRIAGVHLDSGDPLLRHKTSRRAAFMKARSEFPATAADEVILLNERSEICEGTITNIFVEERDGTLLTPAVACGLLPGILRAELLDEGRAREAVLTADDLTEGRNVFVGNSLRGLIPARLGSAEPD